MAILFAIVAMLMVLLAPVALAADVYHSRITCSGVQTVHIWSRASVVVTHQWDSGSRTYNTPYREYKETNTNDQSTWAVVTYDFEYTSSGRQCKKVT